MITFFFLLIFNQSYKYVSPASLVCFIFIRSKLIAYSNILAKCLCWFSWSIILRFLFLRHTDDSPPLFSTHRLDFPQTSRCLAFSVIISIGNNGKVYNNTEFRFFFLLFCNDSLASAYRVLYLADRLNRLTLIFSSFIPYHLPLGMSVLTEDLLPSQSLNGVPIIGLLAYWETDEC